MIEFYPQIKAIHMTAVAISGLLFLIRGAALHAGMTWPMATGVRRLTELVDTVLLAAAVTLAVLLHQYPFVNSWLTIKVVLLVVYIGLGTFALKRGSTRGIRIACWLAALLVFGFIVSVALAHHPAGVFAPILTGA